MHVSFASLLFVPLALAVLLCPLWPVWRQWQFPRRETPRTTEAHTEWNEDALDALQSTQIAFAELLAVAERDGVVRGAGEDGIPFLVLGPKDYLSGQLPSNVTRLRMQVVAARHLDVPGELLCDRLMFARNRLNIAHNAIVKTALAGRDATIGPRARVRRWLHAESRVDAAEGAVLGGCCSAGHEITLARRVRFEQVLAPTIRFGKTETPRTPVVPVQYILMQPPANAFVPGDGRWIINGDMSVPPGHRVNAHLVVRGNLLAGTGAFLRGNVRVMGDFVMHHDARCGSAVICDGDMQTGECCQIGGPLIVEGGLQIGAQSEIGSLAQPSSVSARNLRVNEGVVIHGAVQAKRRGEVVNDSNRGQQA
ncbi:hypothetical protein [Viridibacterium curvum]|uniref:Polymer-forming cytoskeletal protein n=1 Tax=Viridibacterium curvum TaxID=1101404 RepID=A0ABP9QX74_9RHOO